MENPEQARADIKLMPKPNAMLKSDLKIKISPILTKMASIISFHSKRFLVKTGSNKLVHKAVVDIPARQVLTLLNWAEAKKVVQ